MNKKSQSNIIKNSRGQTLVEYLIIVAIVAIGTLGIMRVVGHNLSARFATVAAALSGHEKKYQGSTIEAHHHSNKDLSNFMRGTGGNGPRNRR